MTVKVYTGILSYTPINIPPNPHYPALPIFFSLFCFLHSGPPLTRWRPWRSSLTPTAVVVASSHPDVHWVLWCGSGESTTPSFPTTDPEAPSPATAFPPISSPPAAPPPAPLPADHSRLWHARAPVVTFYYTKYRWFCLVLVQKSMYERWIITIWLLFLADCWLLLQSIKLLQCYILLY